MFTTEKMKSIFRNLHRILDQTNLQTQVYNMWIESPKGKYRQLCLVNRGWRLYYHMLNIFLSYIYDIQLSKTTHEGFIFNRGTKTWWESLLWGDWLHRYEHLVEVDFSSGFPNLNLECVKEALQSDGLLPLPYINMLIMQLKSPQVEASKFPNFESYVEHVKNLAWRTSNRSVPMGLGVSPLLFVITLDWSLRKAQISNKNLVYKFYADDGTFFFNTEGLKTLISTLEPQTNPHLSLRSEWGSLIVKLWNSHPLFIKAGLKLCGKKSGLVKQFNIWIKSFKCLGLNLYTTESEAGQRTLTQEGLTIPLELMGYTRGRPPCPITGLGGTEPSRQPLCYGISLDSPQLNLSLMKEKYRKYFGYLLSRLYSTKDPSPATNEIETHSYLWNLQNSKNYSPSRLKKLDINLDMYNSGSRINHLFLSINEKETIESKWKKVYPNIKRDMKIKWSIPYGTYPSNTEDGLIQGLPANYGYFKKYSELELDPSELSSLKLAYDQLPLNPEASE